MKRYFNHIAEQQAVKVEFTPDSVVRTMDICSLFGTEKDIVEVSKSEYNRLVQHYQKQHETNLSMTITR